MSTRVRRGGSGWRSPQRASWWSNRGGVVPNTRDLVTGFRVARLQAASIGARDASQTTPVFVQQAPPVSATGSTASGTSTPAGTQTSLSPPAKGAPEHLLNHPGLTRSGAYFVVEAETDLLTRAQKSRPLIDKMVLAFQQYATVLQIEMQLREA
jgi:hypothetical protein